MAENESRGFPIAFVAGAVVILVVLAILWFLLQSPSKPLPHERSPLPFGERERAYAQRVRFEGLGVSRAANLLNQEITYFAGEIVNGGDRSISGMEVKLEYHDPYGQVVLREQRRLLDESKDALLPGQRRKFQIAYDHVPIDWNQAPPSIQVSGLHLE